MSSIQEELEGYAIKKSKGNATIGDEHRVEQIGRHLSNTDLPLPEGISPNSSALSLPKKKGK